MPQQVQDNEGCKKPKQHPIPGPASIPFSIMGGWCGKCGEPLKYNFTINMTRSGQKGEQDAPCNLLKGGYEKKNKILQMGFCFFFLIKERV